MTSAGVGGRGASRKNVPGSNGGSVFGMLRIKIVVLTVMMSCYWSVAYGKPFVDFDDNVVSGLFGSA